MRDGIYFPPCECTREKGRINDMVEVLRSVFSETAVCVGNPELRGNQSALEVCIKSILLSSALEGAWGEGWVVREEEGRLRLI